MRKGQVFSIDVFVASSIFAITAVLLLFNIFSVPDLSRPRIFVSDLLSETFSTSVRELNYDVIRLYSNETDSYGIRNPEHSLAEQIVEYHHLGLNTSNPGYATYRARRDNLTQQIVAPIISLQYSYNISINYSGTMATVAMNNRTGSYDEARIVIPYRTIVSGIDRNGDFFGPAVLEVTLWE